MRTWVFAMCADSSATIRKVGTTPYFMLVVSLVTQYTNLPSEYWINELEQLHALLTRFLCVIVVLGDSAFCAKRRYHQLLPFFGACTPTYDQWWATWCHQILAHYKKVGQ